MSALQTPRTGFAAVNGTRLYYEEHGSGPPLLFVHGFTLDHRSFGDQVDALSASHRVVTCDLRGFGRSLMPDQAVPYRHCDDMAALCEHLGLERVVVVGHSVGAHQSLEFALSRPDLVAGWVAISLSGLPGVPFPAEVQAVFRALRDAVGAQGVDAAKAIWRRSSWLTPCRDEARLGARVDAMLADYSGWHWTHTNPAQNIEPNAATRLGELAVPTLIVTGKHDLPYNSEIGELLAAGIRGANALVLEHGGHLANMEEPEPLNRAIAELAARV